MKTDSMKAAETGALFAGQAWFDPLEDAGAWSHPHFH